MGISTLFSIKVAQFELTDPVGMADMKGILTILLFAIQTEFAGPNK